MNFLLPVTATVFASLAIYAPTLINNFVRQRRIRPPHPALVLAFRTWFGILAFALVWLMLHPRPRV